MAYYEILREMTIAIYPFGVFLVYLECILVM